MNRASACAFGCALWCVMTAGPALAAPPVEVPGPLQPWVPWVLADAPEHACAFEGDRALCVWPGQLELQLDAHGGRFAQRVQLDRAQAFALPGSAVAWPSAVRVDGRAGSVLDDGGVPSVTLEPGVHRIEGRFEWNALPERLALGETTATVALRVDGQLVPFPRRDEGGALWLRGTAASGEEGDELALSVARKLEDGVPLLVTTRIDLHVAGRAREVSLGRVLLDGTVPLAVEGELPARLEPDGELRLQVRAGKYRVEVRARSEGSPAAFAYRRGGASWPQSEVWVFQADEALRQVELSGAPAIDPARTELDPDWRSLPAFALRAGVALHLGTVRRGESAPPPNRIGLSRELWLDLDGRGFTARDNIDAQLRQGFRLDLLQGELGHVAAGGQDLLITRSPDGKHAGVELRSAHQALVAEWRTNKADGVLPAVGWSEDVQSLSTTLHLGPGFSVLAATGADSVSQSWLQDWDLFDFFFVLLIAIAAGRLSGWPAAVLALVTLVLCHQEQEAPAGAWFALLGAMALLRVVPAGWFRNLVRVGYALAAVTLLVIAVPFAVGQIRQAIYPQLAQGWAGYSQPPMLARPAAPPLMKAGAGSAAMNEPAPEAEAAAPQSQAAARPEPKLMRQVRKADQTVVQKAAPEWLDDSYTASRALQQDPEASVQMGPGVPRWQWRSWQLRWSGPVEKGHQLRLYLLSPAQNRVLSLLRVVLLAALLALLLRRATPGRDRPQPAPKSPPPAVAAAAVLLALGAVLCGARPARAQLPDSELLSELRTRLTKPAECRPSCASIDELSLDVSDAGLVMVAHVHAGERTAVRLPGPAATWTPAQITLDHKSDAPVALLEDGFLHVRVEPGVHLVELRGPLPATDTLTLAFADRPHRARVQARGYKVDGVHEDGRVEQTLQLSRVLSATQGKPLQGAALPPWLLLEREIALGPSWEAHNRLTRVTPAGTPIMVRVPLLAGEAVTDDSLQVVGGELQVSFGRDQQSIEWSSRLTPAPRLELSAARGAPFSERWTLLCGPIWHCELSGLTPTRRVQNGRFELALQPWPGEKASLAVTRPAPASGQSVAIDVAELDVTPGVRLLDATLALELRSSRGASQRVSLPHGARVQSLQMDGREQPMRIEGDAIELTLQPGPHALSLRWQQASAMGGGTRVPQVRLGRPAANARVHVRVPSERWLLWASGPAWGPAILFWGYLVLVLGAALLLGRMGRSPLRTHQWLLLGLGLTQVPAPAVLVVVGWFFVMAYRERMPQQSRWVHNLSQLALGVWTLSALGVLYDAVQAGLLMHPDMQVAGAGSDGNDLRWYVDRVSDALPTPAIYSAPMWLWRVSMLLWSLWLAASLVRWLPWAFNCLRHGGLWKKAPKRAAPMPPAVPPPAPQPPPGSP